MVGGDLRRQQLNFKGCGRPVKLALASSGLHNYKYLWWIVDGGNGGPHSDNRPRTTMSSSFVAGRMLGGDGSLTIGSKRQRNPSHCLLFAIKRNAMPRKWDLWSSKQQLSMLSCRATLVLKLLPHVPNSVHPKLNNEQWKATQPRLSEG